MVITALNILAEYKLVCQKKKKLITKSHNYLESNRELVELRLLYAKKRRLRLFDTTNIITTVGTPSQIMFYTPGQFTKIVEGPKSYSQRVAPQIIFNKRFYLYKLNKFSVFQSLKNACTTLQNGVYKTKSLKLFLINVYNNKKRIIYQFSQKRFLKFFSENDKVFEPQQLWLNLKTNFSEISVLLLQFFYFNRVLLVFLTLLNSRRT